MHSPSPYHHSVWPHGLETSVLPESESDCKPGNESYSDRAAVLRIVYSVI